MHYLVYKQGGRHVCAHTVSSVCIGPRIILWTYNICVAAISKDIRL